MRNCEIDDLDLVIDFSQSVSFFTVPPRAHLDLGIPIWLFPHLMEVVAFNHVWSRNAWNNACLPAELCPLRVARQVKSLHKQQTTDNLLDNLLQEAYRKCSRIDLT